MSDVPLVPSPAPDDGRKPFIPIVRCNAKNNYRVRAVIVSSQHYGTNTHYSGRTVPCLAPVRPCKFCDDKRAVRWLGYVHATDPVYRVKRFLLELTPGVVPTIQRYVDQFGTLRNSYVELTRSTPHPTARLQIELTPHAGCTPGELPVEGNIADDLWRLWNGSLGSAGGDTDGN